MIVQDGRRLTDVELELMNIVWSLGEATVHSLQERLPSERQLAYTSVSTILRILEKKGVLRSRKEGRTHVYIPVLSKEQYERISLEHIIVNVFDKTPSALVRTLVDSQQLSKQDLAAIQKLIEERLS